MANQIVYVLASTGNDPYSAMARISVASLRLTNPGVQITVVCDAVTDQAIRAARDPLRREVDQWLAFETPPGDGSYRSKFLKSSLRQRVSGPFLYLDVDTIVRDDIAALFQMEGDIAGAPNHSREDFSRQVWEGDQAILREMQWETRRTFYVNSGVLWASESEGADRVYRLWHDKWQASHRRLQDSRDQPALNAAILESNVTCARMACRYNAQIGSYPLSMRDAAIWHYYYSLNYQAFSHIEQLIQQAIGSQQIDVVQLRNRMESQVLWPRAYWIEGPGIHMVNGGVRDLVAAVQSGQGAETLFRAMQGVDPVYAKQVLAKTMVDSYWGNMPEACRFAWAKLLRRYPFEMFRRPVRRCLVHALRRRGKAILGRADAGSN